MEVAEIARRVADAVAEAEARLHARFHTELAARDDELARLRAELAARDDELARLRAELAARRRGQLGGERRKVKDASTNLRRGGETSGGAGEAERTCLAAILDSGLSRATKEKKNIAANTRYEGKTWSSLY
jgi:hypothetical protein